MYYAGMMMTRGGFWSIKLRKRLPEIPIPIREPDGDGRVALRDVLHHIYDMPEYGNYVYLGVPAPSLSPKDARWAKQIVEGRVD